jgi:predicted GNAT family N-acyltransferase
MKILEPTADEMKKYYRLRWKILRQPLGLEEGTEKDDLEDQSIHRVVKIENQIIGIGRLHFVDDNNTQIRYMAVEDNFRKSGVGKLIVDEFIKISENRNTKKIILYARESVIDFYKKLGFDVVREAHKLENIQHFLMEKIIDNYCNMLSKI